MCISMNLPTLTLIHFLSYKIYIFTGPVHCFTLGAWLGGVVLVGVSCAKSGSIVKNRNVLMASQYVIVRICQVGPVL